MQRLRGLALTVAVATIISLGTGATSAAIPEPPPPPAKTDLVLLMDGSGSVDSTDWTLQKQGYAAALKDAANFPLDGSMAVSVVQWSGSGTTSGTRLEVPLTELDDQADVDAIANKVLNIAQMSSVTNPGDAIRAGTNELLERGREGADATLCMSTDGAWNSGESLSSAQQYAQSNGVDRYSVVAIEDRPYFTAPDAVAAYGPYIFGGGTVTVARNTVEFTSLIAGCAVDALRLRALEVTQGLQDWNNSVPLVQTKPTYVRAFLESADGSMVRAQGRLRGYRDGVELPGSPLTPINAEGVLVDGVAFADRAQFDGSLNFALPASWTMLGATRLELELPGGVTCADENGETLPCTTTVDFEEGWSTDVAYRDIDWPGREDELDHSDLDELHSRATAQFPTSGWSYSTGTLQIDQKPDEASEVNEALDTARELADVAAEQRWYGVVHSTSPDEDDKGGGLSSGYVASGWDELLEDDRDTGYARNRVVHELGHSYGLHHSVNAEQNGYDTFLGLIKQYKLGWCDDEKADTDVPDWPYWIDDEAGVRSAAIGPVGDPMTEVWGFDGRFFGEDDSLSISPPHQVNSLMSYCPGDYATQSRWIGLRDFRQLVDGPRDPMSGDEYSTQDGTGLMMRGTIHPDGSRGVWKPALAVDAAPTADDPSGNLTLVMLDAAGQSLYETRFSPTESHADGSTTTAPDSLFKVVVPRGLNNVARVEVRSASGLAMAVDATAEAPRVSVPAPTAGTSEEVTFSWDSSDVDTEELKHTVLYSADDGATWNPVGIDLSGTSMSVPRWALAGSQSARVRVIASDGVRSTVATSETFVMSNLAPTVSIGSPTDGTTLVGYQTMVLEASATDAEDGELQGQSVRWFSDLDGEIAQGTRALRRADTLSEGTHRITVRATDSVGNVSIDHVTVQVQRVAAPPPPSLDIAFGGFKEPVSSDTDNVVNAGRNIPIKWSVTGSGSDETSVEDARFELGGATYALTRAGEEWHVNVQTPAAWAGSTVAFRVLLADGTVHSARFTFR